MDVISSRLLGTSIGAINASLIAGNKVEERLLRLQEFWRRVERSVLWIPGWHEVADALSTWMTLARGVSGFFETNLRAFLGVQVPLGADHAGYYSTEPLRRTLEELIGNQSTSPFDNLDIEWFRQMELTSSQRSNRRTQVSGFMASRSA
jgi:predicted acylesterase/phospholipase RssA